MENIKVSTWEEFRLERALESARQKVRELTTENQKLQFELAELKQRIGETKDDSDKLWDALMKDLETQPDPEDMLKAKEEPFNLFNTAIQKLDELCDKLVDEDEMQKIQRYRIWLETNVKKHVRVKVNFRPETWSYEIYKLSGFDAPVSIPVNDVLTHKVKIDDVLNELGYNAYME